VLGKTTHHLIHCRQLLLLRPRLVLLGIFFHTLLDPVKEEHGQSRTRAIATMSQYLPCPALRSVLLHLTHHIISMTLQNQKDNDRTNLLLIRQQLLHLIRIRNVRPLLHRLALPHPLLPRLQRREILNLDPRPPSRRHPAPVRDIGDSAFAADEVVGSGVREVLVEHAVEAAGLVLVAVDAVFDVGGGVAGEVVGLALHRALYHSLGLTIPALLVVWACAFCSGLAYAGVHEEQPIGHL